MSELVQVFKCRCVGNYFKMAGQPNPAPSKKELREIGELITDGCSVIEITIDDFNRQSWSYCGLKNHPAPQGA